MKIVAFSGNSNSGKTTLIEKIAFLLKDKKVCIIKHDPKDKALFDKEGKDSDRFYKSGAAVAILGERQSAIRIHKKLEIATIKNLFSDYDYLFIEGLKELPFCRITIAREVFDERFIPYSQAFAIDESINKNVIPKEMAILDLNNPQSILEWIDKNIKDS